MNHSMRDYARRVFTDKLGTGAISRNAEISILNWAVHTTREMGQDASWENDVFRRYYKMKLNWLITEMGREEKVNVALAVDGDRVQLNYIVGPQLALRLKRKELDVKKLANYSSDVLWPSGPWSQTMLKSREKDMQMEKSKAKEEDYNGLFKCGKCKSVKTTYYQMQTRSADEPMVSSQLSVLYNLILTPPPTDYVCYLQELREPLEVLSAIYYSQAVAALDVRYNLVLMC
jgi:hypothetical protein